MNHHPGSEAEVEARAVRSYHAVHVDEGNTGGDLYSCSHERVHECEWGQKQRASEFIPVLAVARPSAPASTVISPVPENIPATVKYEREQPVRIWTPPGFGVGRGRLVLIRFGGYGVGGLA